MVAVDIKRLEASVEALIAEQVAAYEAELREQLTRRLKVKKRKSAPAKSGRPALPKAPRAELRTPEEIDELAERFFEAVEAAPGQSMRTLAATIGISSRKLERAVRRLRDAGRIKTVGTRRRMRYYAMPRTGKSDGIGSSS